VGGWPKLVNACVSKAVVPKQLGTMSLMVSAASPPALAKNARTGHPQFRNGEEESGKPGHPRLEFSEEYSWGHIEPFA
jgi:hypothetical protein